MYRRLSDEEIAEIRRVVAYDPITGGFTYRVSMPKQRVCIGQPMRRYVAADGRRFQIRVRRNLYNAARVAWLLTFGVWPDGQIDHINHDPGDNRLANLRVVDASGNQRNRSLNRNSRSGINGVSWCSRWQKWRAYISVGGKPKTLGYFHSLDDAAAIRAKADITFGFHQNHGRAA